MSKSHAVASLGWVTPGAATKGVTPLFFNCFSWKTWRPFFCSSLSLSLSLFIAFTRVSPPPGCRSPHTFFTCPTSFLVSPLFFVNLPTKFFSFRCHPPGGCHPARSSPLVTPLIPCQLHMQKNTEFKMDKQLNILLRSSRDFYAKFIDACGIHACILFKKFMRTNGERAFLYQSNLVVS